MHIKKRIKNKNVGDTISSSHSDLILRMGVSDILYIVSTVAATQAAVDILANKFVYSNENYQHRVSTLDRMRIKRDKALASPSPENNANSNNNSKSNAKAMEKYEKKIQRAEDDYAMAASNVAQKHSAPKIFNSIIFVILYRILYTEYGGKVIAILPYEPWGIIRRISMRGVSFAEDHGFEAADASRVQSVNQACGFLFIYLLCNWSVKVAVTKLLGKKAPSGTEKGFLTMMDDPRGQKLLQQFGVDTDEINEMRKIF